MKRIFFTVLLIAAICRSGQAQDFDRARLDSYFSALEANNKFMGSVAVSLNGDIIYSRSVGYADFGEKIKADAETKYRIGSISKTFTTVLILKAVEEGMLVLNQTIDKYFSFHKKFRKDYN